MSIDNNESISQILVIELLEAAINQALSSDLGAIQRIQALSGRVIRIKTHSPDFSFYVVLCDDGVQLFTEHEGPVDARLKVSSWLFARHVLGVAQEPEAGDEGDKIKVTGDVELLAELFAITTEYSVWALLGKIIQHWLPDFESFDDVLQAIREYEPSWVSRIEHLPQLANDTLTMLEQQQDVQQQLSNDVGQIKQMLESSSRANQISTVIGFLLIMVAFLAHNGYLQVAAISGLSLDTMIMLIVAMVLLVPRLWGGVKRKEEKE